MHLVAGLLKQIVACFDKVKFYLTNHWGEEEFKKKI